MLRNLSCSVSTTGTLRDIKPHSCHSSPVMRSFPHKLCGGLFLRHHALNGSFVATLTRAQRDDSPDMSAFEKMFLNSSLFQSEIVMGEFESIMKEFESLSALASSFWKFDVGGKRIYLEKLDALGERMEIFISRMRLSGDPAAREYLNLLNTQLTKAGTTFDELIASSRDRSIMLRRLTDMEERAALTDPQQQELVRQQIRDATGTAIDVRELSYDPDYAKAFMDPEAFVVVKNVIEDPSSAIQYMNHPKFGKLARKLWEISQKSKL